MIFLDLFILFCRCIIVSSSICILMLMCVCKDIQTFRMHAFLFVFGFFLCCVDVFQVNTCSCVVCQDVLTLMVCTLICICILHVQM